MSDNDFLKEFGKNLGREQRYEASGSDWEKLASSLGAQDRRRRRRRQILAWAFPLVASSAFVLLGAMLWQTRSQSDAMQIEIARLRAVVAVQKSTSTTDTTVRHISVIQYDTIYRTVVLRTHLPSVAASGFGSKNITPIASSVLQKTKNQYFEIDKQEAISSDSPHPRSPPAAPVATLPAGSDQATPLPHTEVIPPEAAVKNASDHLSRTPTGQVDEAKIQIANAVPDGSPRSPGLYTLPQKVLPALQSHVKRHLYRPSDLTVVLPEAAPRPVPMIRRLRPHSAMVGITSGLLFPRTAGVEYRNNYTIGLAGQIALGRHLRLLVGAEYGSANFKVRGSASDNFKIPPVATPNPNDVLNYVELQQPLWDFSLGLRYVFMPEKRLHPFIGASWAMEQTQEERRRYKFVNALTEEPTYVLVQRNGTRFNANGLQIGTGLEWVFAKRLSFRLEGIYQWQRATSVPLLPERWGLRAGLGYRF